MHAEVPRLLEMLCRAGNADHGVARQASLVQLWRRMHSLKLQFPDITDDSLVKRAEVGQSRDIAKSCPFVPKFVMVWSGGAKAEVLKTVETFERTRKMKRQLRASDLKALGEAYFDANRVWVPAIVKAMIAAPKSYAETGLLTPTELKALSYKDGQKFGKAIKEASEYMVSAHEFLQAHLVPNKCSAADAQRRLDELAHVFSVP